MPFAVVGQRVAREEGPEKVSGRALYSADVLLEGVLWGKCVRSPHPYARILRVAADRALRVPGVRAILTAADIFPVLTGLRTKDQPVLARDVVRFAGERVAAVAADDQDAAEEALALIQVEYEPLEPVLDPEAALQPGAPLLHPLANTYEGRPPGLPDIPNLQTYQRFAKGDLERGLAESELIFEDSYSCSAMHQAFIEPRASVVDIDQQGRVRVWSSQKAPHRFKYAVAEAIGVGPQDVTVEFVRVGGEFGGKGALYDAPLAYFLARQTGRPVKMVMTYSEEFQAGNPRHPCRVRFKTGVKRDGRLWAHSARVVFDGGAYAGYKPVPGTTLGGARKAGGAYRIPHVLIESPIVYTNHVPGGFMRSPGDPQVNFAVESHMDSIAHGLGIDPYEFRLRNVLVDGDTAPAGEVWRDVTARPVLVGAVQASYWGEPRAPHVGRGMAIVNRHIGTGASTVVLTAREEGTVSVLTGTPDAGPGVQTVLRQVVAEVLTLPLSAVHVLVGNTDETPDDDGQGASRHTHVAGQAAYHASQELAGQMRALAAELHGWAEAKVQLVDGQFRSGDGSVEGVGFQELARRAAQLNGEPLRVEHRYENREVDTECFGAQVAEVRVDPETGRVELLHVAAANDTGTIIYPIGAEGQIEGGVVQGVGFALMEELRTENGLVTNPHFGDYKVPTFADVPALTTVLLQEPPGPAPFGGRAVGEHSLSATPAAIANAIYDAVGVRVKSTPITAEKVYRLLREKSRSGSAR